jgi:hypothetical protein
VDKLERIDVCLRVLKSASEVRLSETELHTVRRIALAYLDAELGLAEREVEEREGPE